MNPAVDFFLGTILVGIFFTVLLTIAWKLLKIAAVGLMVGSVAMYFLIIYVIFQDFSGYLELLSNRDQEAIWFTAYLVVVTLGVIGWGVWKVRDFFLYEFDLPLIFRKKSAFQHSYQEQTYQEPPRFQQPGDLRLRDLELLGLERSANDDEIKAAYRQLSKKYHPDLNPDPHATIIFKQIQKAYTNLIN